MASIERVYSAYLQSQRETAGGRVTHTRAELVAAAEAAGLHPQALPAAFLAWLRPDWLAGLQAQYPFREDVLNTSYRTLASERGLLPPR